MDLQRVAPLHPQFDPALGLLRLELDHGKANEIGSVELDALDALCDLLEHDDSIRCLCTTSRRSSARGTKIFISGANVSERVGWSDERVKQHVLRQRELMRRLRHVPVFTVALTHGVTFGWGVEFLLTADYTIATDTARFSLPETGLGIVPGARGTAELALQIGPAQALRLGCTGEEIDAATARQIGLVHELAPSLDDGLTRVAQLAARLATRSPTAVAAYKRGLLTALGRPEAERLAIERAAYELCVDSGEAAIGRAAFSARRADSPKTDPKPSPAPPEPTIAAPTSPAWGARRLETPR
ncbi:MAG: enoyl-CoA hydratase/isomerase family protein [Myxococcales bacterium]|nr:enoyl-CoA hydratase/isomerase family protein [Myxococcales bacterium]